MNSKVETQNYLQEELYTLLQKENSIFDFIQSSSLDGIWYWDMQHPEEEWMSPKFWTTLGFDPNEMPHKASAWQHLINQEDLAKAYELVQKHCENPNFPYEQIIRYTHKNGSTVWIKCRGIAIRDENGVPLRMLGAHHDITDIKNAELELKASKEEIETNEVRYKDLLNHLEAGIVVHDHETSILHNNQKASELLGLTEDQMKGKTAYDPDWQFVDEHDELMLTENFPVNIIKRTKQPLKDYIVGVFRPKMQDKVWLYVNGFAVLNNDETIKEIVISFIDFTTKKLAEEQLIIAKEKAEESSRFKTAFLQNMSHEIRTPLNAIVGFSKMLIDAELPVESKKGFSSIIENSTQQLLNIVNDILTISSIETKQEELHLEEINVNELLSELLAVFEAQNSTNRFIFLENSQDIIIKNDRTKIYQIVSNLLTNAQKFTSNGTIQFGYQLKENDIEFFVKDDGIGILEDDQNKIFGRFIQADASTTKKYGGNGLGLSISKGFVELMGGKIWVESKFGKGATFYFKIPL